MPHDGPIQVAAPTRSAPSASPAVVGKEVSATDVAAKEAALQAATSPSAAVLAGIAASTAAAASTSSQKQPVSSSDTAAASEEVEAQESLSQRIKRVGPLSHGPLPAESLSELPEDALRASRDGSAEDRAPWTQAYIQRFAPPTDRVSHAIAYNMPPSSADEGVPPQAGMSPLVFGAGTFGLGQYSPEDQMHSTLPVRTLRLAMRYGINCFDASPYYANSEAILGRALRVLRPEHPRRSYYLLTKCGRYGPNMSQFDYSPQRVRRSVEESLIRLDARDDAVDGDVEQAQAWIDQVLMHDVEFVCTPVGRSHDAGMGHSEALHDEALRVDFGIGTSFSAASHVHGRGDEKVLAAVHELFALKHERKIKMVGVSGYPLPVLLRLARLVATTAPYEPLDSILSYSNHTLHSDLLPGYRALLEQNPWDLPGAPPADAVLEDGTTVEQRRKSWRAPLVLNASPFSMGMLTDAGPPKWHPWSDRLKSATGKSIEALHANKAQHSASSGSSPSSSSLVAETALQYGIRGAEQTIVHPTFGPIPALRTLVGLADLEQVHTAVEAYRTLSAGSHQADQEDSREQQQQAAAQAYSQLAHNEQTILHIMQSAGVFGESWQSPPDSQMDRPRE